MPADLCERAEAVDLRLEKEVRVVKRRRDAQQAHRLKCHSTNGLMAAPIRSRRTTRSTISNVAGCDGLSTLGAYMRAPVQVKLSR